MLSGPAAPSPSEPQASFPHRLVREELGDERDHTHDALAAGTDERIHFVHPADEPWSLDRRMDGETCWPFGASCSQGFMARRNPTT